MSSRAQLLARLRRQVREAAARGEPLPGEHTLAERLGASRPALREALVELEVEGLIRRRPGTGTAVNPVAAGLTHRFDRQAEFASVLEAHGYEAAVEVIEAGWVELGDADAEALDVAAGSPAYRTVKRWRADGQVAMVAVDQIAVDDDADTTLEPEPTTSLFLLVEDLTGDVVEWEVAWPSAASLDRRLARWFGERPGLAVLTMELVGVGRSGRRRYRAFEWHRPGVVPAGFVRTVGR